MPGNLTPACETRGAELAPSLLSIDDRHAYIVDTVYSKVAHRIDRDLYDTLYGSIIYRFEDREDYSDIYALTTCSPKFDFTYTDLYL